MDDENKTDETVLQEDNNERKEDGESIAPPEPPADEPKPCVKRAYRRSRSRKRKPETEEERLERIIAKAEPAVHPQTQGEPSPQEITCRARRSLLALREHCRKRGIKHPLFDVIEGGDD
jgi:hypothetical protein